MAGSFREQQIIWVKPQPSFEILFRLVNDLKPDENGRFSLTVPNENKGQEGIQGFGFS